MILIKSQPYDLSTDHVMEWIEHLGQRSVRIDKGNKIDNVSLTFNADAKREPGFKLTFEDGREVLSEQISSFWSRRGKFELKNPHGLQEGTDKVRTVMRSLSLFDWIEREWEALEAFIAQHLATKKQSLSNPETNIINKLYQLSVANEIGLKIPPSLVTTDKKELSALPFARITKALWEGASFVVEDERYYAYTSKVGERLINALDDQFFPSYFQEELDKAYELRIFYLEGKCYPMAIFSQLDKQTRLDFRAYNWKKPNRTVPYILPGEIERKLIKFMRAMKLLTGSIDLVVTKGGDYVFLEVNPVGQFGMVSYPCNYRLEKKIAEFLTRNVNSDERKNA